jgi:hypothetical protein
VFVTVSNKNVSQRGLGSHRPPWYQSRVKIPIHEMKRSSDWQTAPAANGGHVTGSKAHNAIDSS